MTYQPMEHSALTLKAIHVLSAAMLQLEKNGAYAAAMLPLYGSAANCMMEKPDGVREQSRGQNNACCLLLAMLLLYRALLQTA